MTQPPDGEPGIGRPGGRGDPDSTASWEAGGPAAEQGPSGRQDDPLAQVWDRGALKWLPPPPQPPPGSPVEPVNPPAPVEWSFRLWAVSGALYLLGYVLALLGKQQVITDMIAQNREPRITGAQIASGTETLLWVLLFGAVVFGLLFLLFTHKAREGTRSARNVLVVLALVTATLQWVLFGTLITSILPTVVTLAAIAASLAALVLLFLPSVADYFPKITLGGPRGPGGPGPRPGAAPEPPPEPQP
jgi:hypothetical protein